MPFVNTRRHTFVSALLFTFYVAVYGIISSFALAHYTPTLPLQTAPESRFRALRPLNLAKLYLMPLSERLTGNLMRFLSDSFRALKNILTFAFRVHPTALLHVTVHTARLTFAPASSHVSFRSTRRINQASEHAHHRRLARYSVCHGD